MKASRKFLGFIICIIVLTGVLISRLITGAQFVQGMEVITSVFFVANVADKFSKKE